MSEPRFIISEKQILNAVKFALELNIQEQRIVDILMHDVEFQLAVLVNSLHTLNDFPAESEDT